MILQAVLMFNWLLLNYMASSFKQYIFLAASVIFYSYKSFKTFLN